MEIVVLIIGLVLAVFQAGPNIFRAFQWLWDNRPWQR